MCVCMLWWVCTVYACYGVCVYMHATVGVSVCIRVHAHMHTVTALSLPFLFSRQMLQAPDYCWFCQCPYTKELLKPQSPGEGNSFQM